MNDKKDGSLRRSIANSNLNKYSSILKSSKKCNNVKANLQANFHGTCNDSYSFTFYVDIASTPIKRLPRSSTPKANHVKQNENKKYQIIHMQLKRLSFL